MSAWAPAKNHKKPCCDNKRSTDAPKDVQTNQYADSRLVMIAVSALAYLTEFSALLLLLSVAALPRPFGRIDHFDRSLLYLIGLDFSLD
jgi:hypothetical protein